MDIEKTMQFIVEHQAKHEVEIQQIREMVRGLAKNQTQLQQTVRDATRGHAQLKQTVRGLVAAFNRRMDRLERSQDRTDKKLQGAAIMIADLTRDVKALTKAVHSLARRNGGRRK